MAPIRVVDFSHLLTGRPFAAGRSCSYRRLSKPCGRVQGYRAARRWSRYSSWRSSRRFGRLPARAPTKAHMAVACGDDCHGHGPIASWLVAAMKPVREKSLTSKFSEIEVVGIITTSRIVIPRGLVSMNVITFATSLFAGCPILWLLLAFPQANPRAVR